MLLFSAVTDKQEKIAISIGIVVLLAGCAYLITSTSVGSVSYSQLIEQEAMAEGEHTKTTATEVSESVWPAALDTALYDEKLLALSHYQPPKPTIITTGQGSTTATTTYTPPSPLVYSSSSNVTVNGKRWPSAAAYPYGDAILPNYRILAYYGNFFSVHMGILGEYPEDVVIQKLASTTELWEAADPDTPVMPAIEYIAMVAQADAGADGMYRAMMPAAEIEKGYALAKKINAIYILDLQIGLSTIERELPKFRTYIERPEVHIAIDPEFSMKTGERPGTVIGTFDARDINYVIDYMSEIVREKQLPPKVLIVHRFTQNMITNYQNIKSTPEVQVIINMDGWGSKELKNGTYTRVIEPEPVQFTGVKIFYKNDLKPPSTGLWTPQEVLNLHPTPIYIQYQ